MKATRLMVVVSVVAVMVAVGAIVAVAQPADNPPAKQGDTPQAKQADAQVRRGEFLAKRLNLTPEQAAKVEQILADHQKKVQALREEMTTQLGEVLNEEQMAAFRELGKGPRGMAEGRTGPGRMGQAHIGRGEQGRARRFGRGRGGEGRFGRPGRGPWRGEGKGQPGRPAMRALGVLGQLDLTDQQKEQVQAIMQEARTSAQSAQQPQQRMETMKAAWDKISAEVLTDAQRRKLVQLRQQRPGRPEGDKPQRPWNRKATTQPTDQE